jgi:chorismate synthase
VGDIALEDNYRHYDLALADSNAARCPDPQKAQQMISLIEQVKADGDTIGGIITGVIRGCPPGLGEPEAGKLHAQLAAAMMSINAAKGFEYGEGFAGVTQRGSQQNDRFVADAGKHAAAEELPITTATNHSGGIQGGISNGQDIYFRVAFKPVATLLREQHTVDTSGQPATITARGRHDPCVLPRAVPVVEAMAAMVILDNLLLNKTAQL